MLAPGGVVDIAGASGGDLPSDPIELLRRWPDLVHAFRELSSRETTPLDEARLRIPVPRPGSIVGLVANYRLRPAQTRPCRCMADTL